MLEVINAHTSRRLLAMRYAKQKRSCYGCYCYCCSCCYKAVAFSSGSSCGSVCSCGCGCSQWAPHKSWHPKSIKQACRAIIFSCHVPGHTFCAFYGASKQCAAATSASYCCVAKETNNGHAPTKTPLCSS